MSMYRQLWLSIFVSALLALTISLLASLLNARDYLEQELAAKNHDNATTLAISLSRDDIDDGDVIVTTTALFNNGHYDQIQIVDPEGWLLVDLTSQETDLGAPDWFVNLLPLRVMSGTAQINQGWSPLGTITLISRSQFAYKSLWQTALTMIGAITAAGLLGGLLVTLVLGRLKRPINAVIEQAKAITEHRYMTIPEPNVPELKQLAAAMNDAVGRIRQQIEEDARRCESLRREANYDPVTGLVNRNFFLSALDNALDTEDTVFAALVIIRFNDLARINREQGRDKADELLRRLGRTIIESSIVCSGVFAGRLNGSDFGLLLPSSCEPGDMLNDLHRELIRIIEPYAGPQACPCISYSNFRQGETPAQLLARVDTALAGAEATECHSVCTPPLDANNLPASTSQWRSAIQYALTSDNALKLVQHTIKVHGDNALHRECSLRIRLTEDGEWQPASHFLPQAERLGLIQELDLATLALALDELEADSHLGGLWVSLSAKSIGDVEFLPQMMKLLQDHPDSRTRLWLEIPESGGLRRLTALRNLAKELKPLGCHIGLEHYGIHFNQIGLLYDLGLDFLKIDASFIQNIDQNEGNQAFLASVCSIAHDIGIKVYAEGVETEAELKKLVDLGFDGVTGVAVREI